MVKYALSLLILLVPTLALAKVNCAKNPTFCDILTLKPHVNRAFALSLSKSISKYAKKFGLNPKHSVAIAMQESSFANVDRLGTVVTDEDTFVRGVTDMGVFQLNIDTLHAMIEDGDKIDVERLRRDVDYQTYWHMKILKRKIKTCESQRVRLGIKTGEEWSCYHSFNEDPRLVYRNFVAPYLKKITPDEEE